MKIGAMVIAITQLVGCGEKAPPREPPSATPGAMPSAAPAPASTPPLDAGIDQAAIDRARRSGTLDVLQGSKPFASLTMGPPDAWWHGETPCPGKSTLRTEEKGPVFVLACVGPDGVQDGRFAHWNGAEQVLEEEGMMRAGKLDGVHTTFVAGKVKARMSYRRGVEHGTSTGTHDGAGEWAIDFRDGVITSVRLTRDGARVPAAQLATDELCHQFVARMGQGAPKDARSDRRRYISCRARTRIEVDCVLDAKTELDEEKCLGW